MKNRCIIFFLSIIIIMTGVVCFSKTTGVGTSSALPVTEYLRIHIRANSNAEDDQAVKYKVRDVIVQTLTPALKDCTTKSEAREKLCQNLTLVTSIADGVLKENGYAYGAKATLRLEEFPTRVYNSLTLPSGCYEALIVELGDGAGDNWWCVVYPPLCFAATDTNVIYRSKIKEIIERFYS